MVDDAALPAPGQAAVEHPRPSAVPGRAPAAGSTASPGSAGADSSDTVATHCQEHQGGDGCVPGPLASEHLDDAVCLLRSVVPSPCAGLTPYHSDRCAAFLRSAGDLPEEQRTLFVRAIVEHERLVGVADWRLFGDVLFLNGVAVDGDRRGHGLGRALLTDGIGLAEQWGCSALELDVGRDNEPAQRLYDDLGFVARDGAVWAELPDPRSLENASPDGALLNPELPWRVRNWPTFTALLQAYGFADLELGCADTVRRTPSEAVSVRVLPGGWRVTGMRSAGTAWALAGTLANAVGAAPSRLFTVVDEGAELPPGACTIGSFRRLRRGMRRTSEGTSPAMAGLRR